MCDIAAIRATCLWMHPSFIYRLTDMHAEEKEMCDYLDKCAQQILAHAQKNRASTSRNAVSGADGEHSMNLVDKLLEMEHKSSVGRERTVHNLHTFIFAVSNQSETLQLQREM